MRAFGIRAKILGMACLALAGALVAIESYDVSVESALVEEVRHAVEALTEAMQVSVQQLGPSAEPDEELLRDYVRRLGPAGIRQITVLDPAKQRVAGSHDPPHAFLIEEGHQGEEVRSAYDLLVPIVIGASKLGYIELRMTSGELEGRLRALRLERAELVGVVFVLALVVIWIITRQISRPIEALRVAALRIREGALDSPLPAASGDEVGALVLAFGDMLSALRERDALRQRLEERERDALLGRMAASIAHDIRNPLNYLSLAVDHLVAEAHGEGGAEQIGGQMKSEIERANTRIAEFLRLGKPIELHPQEISVRTLLGSVATSMTTPKTSVEIAGDDVGAASWDASVIETILRGLLTNAFQAAEGGAVVTLRTESLDEDTIAIHVEDRGPGLAADVLEHLFEPYFTTKEKGVGIGLVLARRAARDHHGELTAANHPGGGARFTLTLPRRLDRGSK